jgi:hypothetical protein
LQRLVVIQPIFSLAASQRLAVLTFGLYGHTGICGSLAGKPPGKHVVQQDEWLFVNGAYLKNKDQGSGQGLLGRKRGTHV